MAGELQTLVSQFRMESSEGRAKQAARVTVNGASGANGKNGANGHARGLMA